MKARLLLLIPAIASAIDMSTPGMVDVAFSASIIGKPKSTAWTVYGNQASIEDGWCHYVGQVKVRASHGKCPNVILNHLTEIEGINAERSIEGAEYSKNWKYFHCVYDGVVTVTMNRECPDVMVSSTQGTRPVIQEVFFAEENQARYYRPGDNVPDISMAIPLDGFGKFRKYQKQVLYRDLYDWSNQCSPSDCSRETPETHDYDSQDLQPSTMRTFR